jgi:hypothetical protein
MQNGICLTNHYFLSAKGVEPIHFDLCIYRGMLFPLWG